jgi:hypothetical protein
MATLVDQVDCVVYRWRYNSIVTISLDRMQILRFVPYPLAPTFVVNHRFGCVTESGARVISCISFGAGHEGVARVL